MSHPIENMLTTTMEQLRKIVDVNTVVGAPVAVGDAIILPVSRVSLGFLTGGGEYAYSAVGGRWMMFQHRPRLRARQWPACA